MNAIENWFQSKLLPTLTRWSDLKYLVALKDGMVITVPFTILGSIFMIIGNLPIPGWYDTIAPISPYINAVTSVTFGLLGLIICIGMAYEVSKLNKLDTMTGVAVIVICYVIAMLNDEFAIDPSLYGAGGIFTAIIVAIVAAEIMHFCVRHNQSVRLPDSVPPAVGKSFAALIPGGAAMLFFWLIRCVCHLDINNLITMIFSPLVVSLNNVWGVLFLTFITLVLWVFGIHGNNVLSGISSPIYLQFLAANIEALNAGEPIPYIAADGFLNFGMNIGGTGAILGLTICMLFFAKSKRYKALSGICFPPSIFGISEPTMFGFPVVLNFTLAIPFIFGPLILIAITYFLMDAGIIGHVVAQIPWTTPPILAGFLVTGGDWRAALWQGIELVLAVAMYFPFFKACDRQAVKEEAEEQEHILEKGIEKEEDDDDDSIFFED